MTDRQSHELKVVHVIGGLGIGGAESMLYRLVRTLTRKGIDSSVISLTDAGAIGPLIEELGLNLACLGLQRGRVTPSAFLRLRLILQSVRPDVVQTWMYHSDLLGGLAARTTGGIPVVWGIHHTTHDRSTTKRRTLAVVRACSAVSRWLPRRIICCSNASLHTHLELGYPENRMIVIPNGFDLDEFSPTNADSAGLRDELRIPAGAPLIVHTGRFHPQKDHRTLLGAIALLRREHADIHVLLCGSGVDEENRQLMEQIRTDDLESFVHLLGQRSDISRIVATATLAVSSSSGEAFPLVLGEAMASGTPCVTTDVGDSAEIVGSHGRVVPPRDPGRLAAAMAEILGMSATEREALGNAASESIRRRYGINEIAARYADVYHQAAHRRDP